MSPMERTGLRRGSVKAKFDQAALAIQKYLNETVVPAVNAAEKGSGRSMDRRRGRMEML